MYISTTSGIRYQENEDRADLYGKILSDSEMINVCRRIDKYNEKIEGLIQQLRDTIGDDGVMEIEEQCYSQAWASHIIKHYLHQPDNWETTSCPKRIVYKRIKIE
jgi:hypothetical protein